jgi:uncharacterized protein YceK
MKKIFIAMTVISLGLSAGCATIETRDYPSLRIDLNKAPNCRCYPATLTDIGYIYIGSISLIYGADITDLPPRPQAAAIVPLRLIDLPFSIVTDTILLPSDLIRGPIHPIWH